MTDPREDERRCEICDGPAVGGGVAAMPGIPMSVYYCGACVAAGITHPYWALVVNTAMIGGMERAAAWWRETVEDQLPRYPVARQRFDQDVLAEIQRMLEDERLIQARVERETEEPR